jgi:hypothetical protein
MPSDGKMPDEVLDLIHEAAVEEGYIEPVIPEVEAAPEPNSVPEGTDASASESALPAGETDVIADNATDSTNAGSEPTGSAHDDAVPADKSGAEPPVSDTETTQTHGAEASQVEPVAADKPASTAGEAADASSWWDIGSERPSAKSVGSAADINEWLTHSKVQSGNNTSDVTRDYLNDRIGTVYGLGRAEEAKIAVEQALQIAGRTVENGVIK